MDRRSFLRTLPKGLRALWLLDSLSYFLSNGRTAWNAALTADTKTAANENDEPAFLIYWFAGGGWQGYDMFNPVPPSHNDADFGDLPKDASPLESVSRQIYRPKSLMPDQLRRQGGIFHGPLAEDGNHLFPEMAVLSSMSTGTFHSGDRLKAHFGDYKIDYKARRQPDERTVLQGFAESKGRDFLLPNLNSPFPDTVVTAVRRTEFRAPVETGAVQVPDVGICESWRPNSHILDVYCRWALRAPLRTRIHADYPGWDTFDPAGRPNEGIISDLSDSPFPAELSLSPVHTAQLFGLVGPELAAATNHPGAQLIFETEHPVAHFQTEIEVKSVRLDDYAVTAPED